MHMACSRVLVQGRVLVQTPWTPECCLWGTECSCRHCSRGQSVRWTYPSPILVLLSHHPPLSHWLHHLLCPSEWPGQGVVIVSLHEIGKHWNTSGILIHLDTHLVPLAWGVEWRAAPIIIISLKVSHSECHSFGRHGGQGWEWSRLVQLCFLAHGAVASSTYKDEGPGLEANGAGESSVTRHDVKT